MDNISKRVYYNSGNKTENSRRYVVRKLKSKTCLNCGILYIPTGSCSKVCSTSCYTSYSKDRRKEQLWGYRRRQGKQVGVGSGGTTGSGKNNVMYKHGLGVCQNNRANIKNAQRYCGHCSKDLIDATHYQWVIHHKDHNKYNNPEDGSNWILLCKRCHQVEHQCWKNYEGATTRSKDRSYQEGSEMPSTQASIAAGSEIV